MFETQKEKNKISVKICLSIFLLVLLTSFWVRAQAQAVYSDVTGDKHSAHVKRDPDPDKARFIVEMEVPLEMQIPGIQLVSCAAFIKLQAHQRNTLARVEATVENESCIPSMGEYELLFNIRDQNGVSRNLTYSEAWEQKDDSVLKSSRDYPIGENVTLKRVVAQSVRCKCTDL